MAAASQGAGLRGREGRDVRPAAVPEGFTAALAALDAVPVVLFCPDQASLDRLQDDIRAGVYGTLPSTLRLSVDRDDFVRVEILANMDLKADTLPLFVIADTFNKVYFCSQGYTIGLGERIHGILTKL